MSLIHKFSCGDVVENRYHLDIKIHEGRWGDIYRATDRLNDRPVAIRFFPVEDDGPKDFERFSAHARELSGLTAPTIATPFDHGMADEVPYLVCHWAHGQSLQDRLAERGPLDLETTILVVTKILKGLDKAHQSRMTHGLIRPVKVVVDELDGDNPLVKIVDFQIWRFYEWSTGKKAFDESNLSRRIVRYTSPEVLDEHRVKPSTDIYATGLLAIELLTGEPAFDDNHRVALIARQLSEEAAELSFDVDAGEEFREFIEKLVHKDEQERFSAAGQAFKLLKEKSETYLSEPPAKPEVEEPQEPADDSPAQEPSEPIEESASDEGADEISEPDTKQDQDSTDVDADEELFEGDPSSMHALSDGESLDGTSDAKEETGSDSSDDDIFDDEILDNDTVDFGEFYEGNAVSDADIDDENDEEEPPPEIDNSPDSDRNQAGHRHQPNQTSDTDDDFDSAIADEIPKANPEKDRIVASSQSLDSQSTSSASPRRRPGSKVPKDSELSVPLTIAIFVAMIGLLGGASYVFIFQDDDSAAIETAEAEEEVVPMHTIVIDTSPPAQRIQVQGYPRGMSPYELEVSEDDFPLRVRARMDADNIQERTIETPEPLVLFDFNEDQEQ